MKLVWMTIVIATGAMLLIAATLVVKPFNLEGRFFNDSSAADGVASCLLCSGSK